MEIVLAIMCMLSIAMNVYLYTKKPEQQASPFSDDEVDKIKQVLNILTWGGEDEGQN